MEAMPEVWQTDTCPLGLAQMRLEYFEETEKGGTFGRDGKGDFGRDWCLEQDQTKIPGALSTARLEQDRLKLVHSEERGSLVSTKRPTF